MSSAVILTKAVGGNEAAAIFNSAFGSLLGIFVTPLELLFFVDVGESGAAGGGEGDIVAELSTKLVAIFGQLSMTVLAPMVLGQVLRRSDGLVRVVDASKPQLSTTGSLTLLLIIYTTFCDAFAAEAVDAGGGDAAGSSGIGSIVGAGCLVVCIQLTLMSLVFSMAKGSFAPQDVVAILFCATHKSLTLGVPVLKIVFDGLPQLPTLTTPLLMYHPTQIVLGGLLIPTVKAWMDGALSRGGGAKGGLPVHV